MFSPVFQVEVQGAGVPAGGAEEPFESPLMSMACSDLNWHAFRVGSTLRSTACFVGDFCCPSVGVPAVEVE